MYVCKFTSNAKNRSTHQINIAFLCLKRTFTDAFVLFAILSVRGASAPQWRHRRSQHPTDWWSFIREARVHCQMWRRPRRRAVGADARSSTVRRRHRRHLVALCRTANKQLTDVAPHCITFFCVVCPAAVVGMSSRRLYGDLMAVRLSNVPPSKMANRKRRFQISGLRHTYLKCRINVIVSMVLIPQMVILVQRIYTV